MEEEKKYTVYKHTFPNEKVYIGITSVQPEKRWRNGYGYLYKDKKGIYRQPLMAYAVMKYGWDNILHEILFENLSKYDAEVEERRLIAEYKSDNRKFGYNIEHGGNATGKISEETKRKMSESLTGRKMPREAVMKSANARKIPVRCIETNIVYASGKEAEDSTGISRHHICNVCKGQRKTAGGCHWEYYIENNCVSI